MEDLLKTNQKIKNLKKKHFSWVYPMPITAFYAVQYFGMMMSYSGLQCGRWGKLIGKMDALTLAHVCSVHGPLCSWRRNWRRTCQWFPPCELKAKRKRHIPRLSEVSDTSYSIRSHHLAFFFLLEKILIFENLKFKAVWLLKAALNSHCGLEQYIIKAMVLRWCTAPICHESTIPLMKYYYNSQLEHHQWCMA